MRGGGVGGGVSSIDPDYHLQVDGRQVRRMKQRYSKHCIMYHINTLKNAVRNLHTLSDLQF